MAGSSGFKKRETGWLLVLRKRLLSFFEIRYDERDQHYQKRAFNLLKNRR